MGLQMVLLQRPPGLGRIRSRISNVTETVPMFPPWTVNFAFWQHAGCGPATGRGLWEAMHPCPSSGLGRSACSSMGTTSAEGLSSPHAGSSQLHTVSTSKSLTCLTQVSHWLYLQHILGDTAEEGSSIALCPSKTCRRDCLLILISQTLSIAFKLSLLLSVPVQILMKKDPPQKCSNHTAQFSEILEILSCLGNQLKQLINVKSFI